MQIFKRTLSALLAVVMIIALCPAVAFAETVTLEEFAQGQHLYTVDFSGTDDVFAGANITTDTKVNARYTVTGDGNAVSLQGNKQLTSSGDYISGGYMWGGVIGNYTADATTYYTMTYKIWMDDASSKGYAGVGGILNGTKTYYNFSTNFNTKKGVFRSRSNMQGTEKSIDLSACNTEVIGEHEYYTIRVTYDGPNKLATAYILKDGESGVHADDWILWNSNAYGVADGDKLTFMLYTQYSCVDSIIRDVNYYQGDIVKPANFTTTTQDATCTEDGAVITSCDCGCGEATTEVLPATGMHDYVDGTCTMCGLVTECQHSFAYACDKVCSLCEEIIRPDADHSYDDECDPDCNSGCGTVREVPTAVVSIGNVNYGSLEAALAAAEASEGADTIKLLADVVEVGALLTVTSDITITADKAVTIQAVEGMKSSVFYVTGGKLILTGASEDAKITVAASTKSQSLVKLKGGDAELTNVVLLGNTASTATDKTVYGIKNEGGKVTATNVIIQDITKGDGINISAGASADLNNVTIDNTSRYGIKTYGTVNIYNGLSISNTAEHAIDIDNAGKVTNQIEDVTAGTITIDTTTKENGVGIIVRKGGALNVTNLSIANTASYGIWLQGATAVATVKNATISSGAAAFVTVADTTLTVENVKVEKCNDDDTNILGDRTGEITFAEHDYVAGETVAPTCLEDGYTPYTCSVCEHSYNGDVVAAAGEHSYDDGVITTAPTCVEEGVKTFTCAACGESYTEAVDALGHHYENDYCTTCGAKDPDACEHSYFTDCDQVCEICGEVTRPDATHTVEHVEAKASDCYEMGNIEYWFCSVCGQAWLDEACTLNTNLPSVKLPMLEAVVSINDYHYGSLEAALAAAEASEGEDTIKLLADVVEVGALLTITSDITITADKAVTIQAVEGMKSSVFYVTGGKLILTGASEDAKITVAASTKSQSLVKLKGGDAELTNVVLLGNTASTATDKTVYGIKNEGGKVTATNVIIQDITKGDGINISAGASADLNNVTIDNTSRYGIKTYGVVNVYNALSISNTAEHAIDIDNGGKVISYFENVAEGTYAITIDTATADNARGILVRAGGELNITHVSIQNVKHNGVDLLAASSVATISNATIASEGYAIATVANSTLTVSNVNVDKCAEDTVNILGNITGEITFAEHDYVAGETVAPTCQEEGKIVYTCSACEHSYTETIEKLPHNYENGSCTACDAKDPDACEHSYVEEITTAATCTEKGVKTFTCSNCGESYTEEIDALGHTEVVDEAKAATCTETGLTEGKHCSVCNEVTVEQIVVDALGHSFGEDLTCSVCAAAAVVSIGDELYTSLEEAVAAANASESADTIKLLADVVEVNALLTITSDITITADKAVTIQATEEMKSSMLYVTGGKLTVTGASADAKITIAASTKSQSLVKLNGGDAELTDVHLKGNIDSAVAVANGNSIHVEKGALTATNVLLTDCTGDGINIRTGASANLDNVTIDKTGRYGIKTYGTVNIYNDLSISNTYDHAIDIADAGKVSNQIEGFTAGTITIDTTSKDTGVGVIVRAGGELDVTNLSIANTASYGIWLQGATAVATIENATVSSGAAAFATVADTTLNVENVKVENVGDNNDNILGTLNGEISYPFVAAEVNGVKYSTLADAVQNANGGVITLLNDSAESITIEANVIIDLAGKTLENVTVAEGYALTLIDTENDDYAGNGYAKVTGTVNTYANVNGKDYIVLESDGQLSAHRYALVISHISLKPDADALGYKATLHGDEAVQAAVTGYGFEMSASGGKVMTYSKTGTVTNGQFSLRLKNIMANNGGEMPINAVAFVTFGQQTTKTQQQTTTMKDTILAINGLTDLSDAQKIAVGKYYDKYSSVMAAWFADVDNNIDSWYTEE